MKVFGYGTPPLQRPAQQGGEVGAQSGLVQSGPFERRIVVARHNPGFIGNARGIGTQSEIVAASLEEARGLTFLLLNDVAKNSTFLADEVFPAGAQFIEHAPWNEHGRCNLGSRMAEFLPSALAVVLEQADIFDAGIALEVKDALGGQAEKVRNLIVAGLPQMTVVARVLHQHFMRTPRVH